jgi:hypothetical protein
MPVPPVPPPEPVEITKIVRPTLGQIELAWKQPNPNNQNYYVIQIGTYIDKETDWFSINYYKDKIAPYATSIILRDFDYREITEGYTLRLIIDSYYYGLCTVGEVEVPPPPTKTG